jgi:hypothetical protein
MCVKLLRQRPAQPTAKGRGGEHERYVFCVSNVIQLPWCEPTRRRWQLREKPKGGIGIFLTFKWRATVAGSPLVYTVGNHAKR